MKLLLVEDEEMTREGLLSSLPWEEAGVTQILQAKDGLEGLELAKTEMVQIVICDIRMPKMDGLTMVSRIMDFNPDIIAIILTGFAEIEYLKQAISLNVVSFIEKPVDIHVLTETVARAVAQASKLELQQQSAEIHSSVVASRLAFQMTVPYDTCEDIIRDLYEDFLVHYGTDKFLYVTTFVVRPEAFPNNSLLLYSIGKKLHDHLLPGHFHIIYSDRVHKDIIYQVYGSLCPSETTLQMIGDKILSYYSGYTRCFVSIGSTVEGIHNAWRSYSTAMDYMGYARFYEPDTILSSRLFTATESDNTQPADYTKELNRFPASFRQGFEDNDDVEIRHVLAGFRDFWYHSKNRDSQIKTVYYTLFMTINQMYQDRHIVSDYTLDTPGVIIDMIDSSFSFLETHRKLCKKTQEYFEELGRSQNEDSIIYRIRNYISENYSDPSLSVKTISENVYLSVSYLCTYFKNGTGITLNQYITDYRLKKAIHLLTDTNMKIVDVANKVGYRDSNYFAKLFKKQTGYSPKEYKRKANE